MSKYPKHGTFHSEKSRMLARWCAMNIDRWPKKCAAYVSHQGWKLSKSAPTDNYRSLSYGWTVCTRSMWVNQKNTIEDLLQFINKSEGKTILCGYDAYKEVRRELLINTNKEKFIFRKVTIKLSDSMGISDMISV